MPTQNLNVLMYMLFDIFSFFQCHTIYVDEHKTCCLQGYTKGDYFILQFKSLIRGSESESGFGMIELIVDQQNKDSHERIVTSPVATVISEKTRLMGVECTWMPKNVAGLQMLMRKVPLTVSIFVRTPVKSEPSPTQKLCTVKLCKNRNVKHYYAIC